MLRFLLTFRRFGAGSFFLRVALLVVPWLAFSACTPSAPTGAATETLEGDTTLARDVAAVERIVYALPSAPQMLALLKQAGATYQPQFMHPTGAQSRYQQPAQVALNIGVYSTDLAMATAFKQNQESVSYFVAIQKLADRIGVASAFDETVISRLDRNRDNADSASAIITRSFEQSSRLLKRYGQEDVARLILVGGWVEGLYLANEFYAKTPKPVMAERIAEQKLVLDNLLLMVAADSAKPSFANVYPALRALEKTFAPVEIQYSFTGVSADDKRKVTRIDNQSVVKITPAQLATLRTQTAALRKQITQ